jgi:Zinc dependent phospholipase C
LTLLKSLIRYVASLLLCVVFVIPANAYSVLTHEELIDLLWDGSIRPLLLSRYPKTTPEELREAHAYAYGGSVLQDLGYYPFGDRLFSDLTHYVRTGDFEKNMFLESTNVNELAFAVGTLAHYVSDIHGHPFINRAVPIEYPKLLKKFGPVVTYDQAHLEHLRTEFGFDVVQVARHRYPPQSFHDFIDFQVSKEQLERAFLRTYGVPLNSVLKREDLAIGTYRRAVSKVIPEMTKVALSSRGEQMAREIPNFNRKLFLYHISRADYEKNWGRDYTRPGPGARFLAFLLHIVPKVGPFRGLSYRDPTPKTEDLYMQSVNQTVDALRVGLAQARKGEVGFAAIDLDTGAPTRAGEYDLADESFRELVRRLQKDQFAHINPELRKTVLAYFEDFKPKLRNSSDSRRWAEDQSALNLLKTIPLPPQPNDNGRKQFDTAPKAQ